MNEATLWQGYSRLHRATPIHRTETCACGGEITATVGLEADAVRQHNDSPRHQAWRARREQGENDG